MLTIHRESFFEQTIKKSVFICCLFPVSTLEEIENCFKKVHKEYPNATHYCYSYRIGENIVKASDDGEPSQTAGVVILDVLMKKKLTNILAVVVRYFGGIKLGAGGLVRAYSSTTSEAVKKIELVPIEKKVRLTLQFPYEYTNDVFKIMSSLDEIEHHYDASVTLVYSVPENDKETYIQALIQKTKNNIKII